MNDQQKYALLSKASYGGQEVPGFTIDRDLSNVNRTTYVDDDTGKAIIAFRGTDLVNKSNKWKDLGTDALVALGMQELGSRFQNAEKATQAVVDKYGKDKVTLTGHSLGGSQGLYVAQKTGLPAQVFNPGVSPLTIKRSGKQILADTVASFFKPKVKSNIVSYTTGIDPISGLSLFLEGQKNVVVPMKKGVKSPHALQNFLP